MQRKKFYKKAVLVAVLLFSCCSPSLLLPTTKDVVIAQKYWDNADSLSLQQGYYLYVNKCGACHTLYRPTKFPEATWRKEVPAMSVRALISAEETELILRYVLSKRETMLNAKAERKKEH